MSIFNKQQQKPMPTFSASQTVLPSAAISRIESGSLAELNVPNLMLKKGEKCCFVDKSYEMVETSITRNVRKSVCQVSFSRAFDTTWAAVNLSL